jgi:hypothetical protein
LKVLLLMIVSMYLELRRDLVNPMKAAGNTNEDTSTVPLQL